MKTNTYSKSFWKPLGFLTCLDNPVIVAKRRSYGVSGRGHLKPAVSNHAVDRYLERVLGVNATTCDIPADEVYTLKAELSETARLPERFPKHWLTWKKKLGGFIYVVDRGCVVTVLHGRS